MLNSKPSSLRCTGGLIGASTIAIPRPSPWKALPVQRSTLDNHPQYRSKLIRPTSLYTQNGIGWVRGGCLVSRNANYPPPPMASGMIWPWTRVQTTSTSIPAIVQRSVRPNDSDYYRLLYWRVILDYPWNAHTPHQSGNKRRAERVGGCWRYGVLPALRTSKRHPLGSRHRPFALL